MTRKRLFVPVVLLIGLGLISTAMIIGCTCYETGNASKQCSLYTPCYPCEESCVMPMDCSRSEADESFNTEAYDSIVENDFLRVKDNPLSTFSIDVDTASYSNVRRFLAMGQLPSPGAVRTEELVNYFSYDYAPPAGDGPHPFAAAVEIADCPWAKGQKLVRIGIKGKEIEQKDRPPCNLVLLLDVSGSMSDPNKLPLVKRGLSLLLEQLSDRDRVAIVVYAGASGLVLPSTPCNKRWKINWALKFLQAGGSTNGGEGIRLAYKVAQDNFIKDGVNRVILCTDGDFNVGTTNQSELVTLVENQAKSNVFLTVLGFGMGNYKDSTLEKLADKGNGNYGYIDTIHEARKIFVDQTAGTLITIAKDVKIQVEFNPARVEAYRLIGYENRMLKKEDFNDDRKDAGEIGAGHTVTALYQIVPVGGAVPNSASVDPLKYQTAPASTSASESDELLTIKLRYKAPDGDVSMLVSFPVKDRTISFSKASKDFQFAAAVASFSLILRNSQYKGSATFESVAETASAAKGQDEYGYRAEFIKLVRTAKSLQKKDMRQARR